MLNIKSVLEIKNALKGKRKKYLFEFNYCQTNLKVAKYFKYFIKRFKQSFYFPTVN